MTARAVRRLVVAVCAACIAGMIVTSIEDSSGGALAFGIVTSAAILCLIVATAVSHDRGDRRTAMAVTDADAEAIGATLEDGIDQLVRQGADEAMVRAVVADAVRYGRASR